MDELFEAWYNSYFKIPKHRDRSISHDVDDLRIAFEAGYHLAQDDAKDKLMHIIASMKQS